MGKGLGGEMPARAARGATFVRRDFFEDLLIVLRIDDDGDTVVILRCGADHGGAANVDIFDRGVEIRTARHGGLERIEIHHQEIDWGNPMGLHGGHMFGLATHREQTAVNVWMQGLHAAVHHLGAAGDLGDVDDVEPRFAQGLGRPARGHERHAVLGERLGEINDASLVADGKEGSRDFSCRHRLCFA